MVNGPGSVIFVRRSVLARRKVMSPTSMGRVRRTGPTTRGTRASRPARLTIVASCSASTPSRAVAKRLE